MIPRSREGPEQGWGWPATVSAEPWLLSTSKRSPELGHRVGAHTELQHCPHRSWWPCQSLTPAPGGPGSI